MAIGAFVALQLTAIPQQSKPPNFVLIVTDDQSWVGTSVLMDPKDSRSRSDYYRTPNIERLARMGMRFTRGYAPAPYCCPTRRSLVIGQTPARHIYQRNQQDWTKNYRQQLSLPRMLKRANPSYRTAHFGKWDSRFDNVSPHDMGYDVSDGTTGNGTGGNKGSGGPAAKDDPKLVFGITQRTCEFIEQESAAGQPFFVQVSHYAVHLDIFYRERSLEAARDWESGKKHTMPEFAAMTSDVDAGIGQLLDKIAALGLQDTTYIFLVSDNGGRLTMPGQQRKQLPRNHPLRKGKGTMYEGGLRVPFIAIGPDIEAGGVCRVPVTGLDLFPTIADLAGYDEALPESLDGGSMTGVLRNQGRGTVTRQQPFLLFHQAVARRAQTAIIQGDYKLVKTWRSERLELFDLATDQGESKDLSASHASKAQELHGLMVEFLNEVGAETRKTTSKSKNQKKSKSRNQEASKSRQRKNKRTASEPVRQRNVLPSGKPNVLFLSIDDLNDWVGSTKGHPQARTPNLDRLAAQGVLFTNAHCTAPVCKASRHSVMSGLRPSTTGWYSNTSMGRARYEKILGETVPMPTHFKRNGYLTMAAGKVFHKGTSDVKGYDYWDEARPKYKWPRSLARRGHGYAGNRGGHFYPFPRDGGAIYQHYKSGVDGQSLCWGALEKTDIPPEGMPDEQVADWAVQRLKQKHDKPFLMCVGFVRPHVPFTAPKKYFDMFPLDEIVMPDVPDDEMRDIPLMGKAMAFGTIEGGDDWNVQQIGPDYRRELVRAYLACVAFVDAQAGKVLDALDNGPNAENTLVVFWSDHGQHLGEKRHWRKQALWEEATRVPLSIRLPRSTGAGVQCHQPVSLVDLYPTLIELCHLPAVKGLEGSSLSPQLIDPRAPRPTPAITTWFYNNHAIRDLHWRYIRYRDGSEELYDHRVDPGEHKNLAGDPTQRRVIVRLRKYIPKTNVVPASIQNGGTDGFGRKVERMRAGGVPPWLR